MKKHLTIRLDEELIKELKMYCIKNNTSITEVITRHIVNLTDVWEKPQELKNGFVKSDEPIRFLRDGDVYYEGQEVKLKENGKTLFILPRNKGVK